VALHVRVVFCSKTPLLVEEGWIRGTRRRGGATKRVAFESRVEQGVPGCAYEPPVPKMFQKSRKSFKSLESDKTGIEIRKSRFRIQRTDAAGSAACDVKMIIDIGV
jgi:hypothetical protein